MKVFFKISFCFLILLGSQISCTKKYFKTLPTPGIYTEGGAQKDCTKEGLSLPDHANWRTLKRENIDDLNEITKKMACDFICKPGFFKVNTESKRACEVPEPGKWVSNGVQKECSFNGQREHFESWEQNPDSGLSTDTCAFTCHLSYTKRTSENEILKDCVLPKQSYFINSNNEKKSCGIAPDNGDWLASQPKHVKRAEDCVFNCNDGYTKGDSLCHKSKKPCFHIENGKTLGNGHRYYNPILQDYGVCDIKTCIAGYDNDGFILGYSSENKCKRTGPNLFSPSDTHKGYKCGTPPEHGNWLSTPQPTTVERKEDCVFTCATGYTVQGTGYGGSCEPPQKGHYVEGGIEKHCTRHGGVSLPSNADWVSPAGGRTKAESCSFKPKSSLN